MSQRFSRLSTAIGRSAPKGFSLASIRGRVVLFAVLAALIPTAITGWISYRQTQRSLERGIDQELRNRAMRTSRTIDAWLAERLYDAQVFASSYEISDRLSRLQRTGASPERLESATRISEYLQSVQQRSPEIVDLAVIDLDGEVIGRTGAELLALPTLWQSRLQAGRPAFGVPQWDSVTGQAVLSIAVPVRTGLPPQDRLIGGLVATSTLEGILEALSGGDTTVQGRLSLVTKGGEVLIDAQGHIAPAAATVAPTVRRALEQNTPLGVYRTSDDVDVIGAISEFHQPAWAVLAEMPMRDAYAGVIRVRNLTLLMLLGALVAVGFVAYQLAQLVMRPLDRLTHAAGEVASGDFAVELPASGGGEVAYLTDVFNFMVTRLREGREELERLSVTDALTGLYNRRLLMRNMVHEVQRSSRTEQPFSVLLMDIDDFKAFNDRHGHQAGDQALIMVAHVLRESVRVIDTVARYGGEEFVIVLPETDLAGATDTAERIRGAVESRMLALGSEDVGVTISVGVAEFPTDGTTVEMVIGSADRVLYRAKEMGRNRVVPARPVTLPGQRDRSAQLPRPDA